MEAWQIVVGLASAIATGIAAYVAWVGPQRAVNLAHAMQQHENKRIAASILFRETYQHAEQFQRGIAKAITRQIEQLGADMELEQYTKIPVNNLEAKNRLRVRARDFKTKTDEAFTELDSLECVINADILALQLLFEDDAKAAIAYLRSIAEQSQILRDTPAKRSEVKDTVKDEVDCLYGAFNVLQNQLRQNTPLPK